VQATIAPFAWSRFGGRLLQDLRLGGMQEEDGIQGRCAEFQVKKKKGRCAEPKGRGIYIGYSSTRGGVILLNWPRKRSYLLQKIEGGS